MVLWNGFVRVGAFEDGYLGEGCTSDIYRVIHGKGEKKHMTRARVESRVGS